MLPRPAARVPAHPQQTGRRDRPTSAPIGRISGKQIDSTRTYFKFEFFLEHLKAQNQQIRRVCFGGFVCNVVFRQCCDQVFDNLRVNEPAVLDQLVAVAGDVSLPALGIGVDDAELLRATVSIVFHSAARVKFDQDLRDAVEINVKGTRKVVDLCRQLPHLKVGIGSSSSSALVFLSCFIFVRAH